MAYLMKKGKSVKFAVMAVVLLAAGCGSAQAPQTT
jgi:hypothetical protein